MFFEFQVYRWYSWKVRTKLNLPDNVQRWTQLRPTSYSILGILQMKQATKEAHIRFSHASRGEKGKISCQTELTEYVPSNSDFLPYQVMRPQDR